MFVLVQLSLRGTCKDYMSSTLHTVKQSKTTTLDNFEVGGEEEKELQTIFNGPKYIFRQLQRNPHNPSWQIMDFSKVEWSLLYNSVSLLFKIIHACVHSSFWGLSSSSIIHVLRIKEVGLSDLFFSSNFKIIWNSCFSLFYSVKDFSHVVFARFS